MYGRVARPIAGRIDTSVHFKLMVPCWGGVPVKARLGGPIAGNCPRRGYMVATMVVIAAFDQST